MDIIITPRLVLRPWNENDLYSLYELCRDVEIAYNCGFREHSSIEESEDILNRILMNGYTLAVTLNNQVIGSISVDLFEDECEGALGYWIGRPYWGNGYMTEACSAFVNYVFDTYKLRKLWAAHHVDNHASHAVQMKCGFYFDHKVDHFHRILRDDYVTEIFNVQTLEAHSQNIHS